MTEIEKEAKEALECCNKADCDSCPWKDKPYWYCQMLLDVYRVQCERHNK